MDFDVIGDVDDKIGTPAPLAKTEGQENSEIPKVDANKPGGNVTNSTSFYGNDQPKPLQQTTKPASNYSANNTDTKPNTAGPLGNNSNNGIIYPIEGLSPYQNRWTIRARVTFKSEIKHWHNQKGEGKLFTVHFLDETGEIRATGFNDQVDALYDVFQEGSVYLVSKCRVNIAKKQFTNIQNEYELMFERNTEVQKCEDADNVPQLRFQFVTISDIANVEKDSTIDVVGVLREVHELSEVTSKTTNKAIPKRDLTIVDRTGYQIRMTVWGKQAQEFSVDEDSIVAFKGVKVSEFNGRSLSMFSSSAMTVNPDIQEAHELKGWYDSQGRNETFMTHQASGLNGGESGMGAGKLKEQRKTLAQVKNENLGMNETPDYFTTKATIVFIKQENISYPACPSPECNKKVIEDGEGGWRCEKCNKSYPEPQYRYVMSVSVNDHTGQAWFSCFDDVGKKIMGMTADELHGLQETDQAMANEAFAKAVCGTFVFRTRGKQDNYNGQTRVRYQVLDANPVDFDAEAKQMAKWIESL